MCIQTEPNKGMQATAYSVRVAALRSRFQPRLMPGVRLHFNRTKKVGIQLT
jgi:hypothetical protein